LRRRAAILLAALLFPLAAVAQPAPAQVDVCFTPAQHCQPRIVEAINAARSEIEVQAYGFTSVPILGALAAAKQRGVDVQVILDKSNLTAQYSGAVYVAHTGIPIWIDNRPAIAHNKTIIIDKRLVIGGSYNYSSSAETRNAENVLFLESPTVAAEFLANWESRRQASMPFSAPRGGQPGLGTTFVLAGIATGRPDDAGGVPDAEKCRLIEQDIAAYLATGHPCACPYSLMRNGSRCDDWSAWSKRTTGSEPRCYLSDFDRPAAPRVSVRVTPRMPPCGRADGQ
jgi:phosphatidylserine/phosphatidylglycerophosphate/cardiolipin synthase-like enzyme